MATRVINCLKADKSLCITNQFNELVPKCTEIDDQNSCEFTYGCYYDSGMCKQIDANYCTMPDVVDNIQLCRKDQNDFCYFSDDKCQVCNTAVGPNDTNKKLISMDGRRCMNWNLGCQPYYQRNNHPACRKYCEFTEQPNNDTYQCVDCKSLNKSVAIDGMCYNTASCKSIKKGNNTNTMIANYGKILNSINPRQACSLDLSTSYNHQLTLLTDKFSSKITFTSSNKDRISKCPTNYQKVPYQPLAPGESGTTLTSSDETNIGKVQQLISHQCICPAGYYLSGENCNACQQGTTTYLSGQKSCVNICGDDQVIGTDGTCKSQCDPNQKIVVDGTVKRCVSCGIGEYLVDGVCTPVPKSYYLPLKTGARTGSQEPVRCTGGNTTATVGSYSVNQCDQPCDNLVDYDGICVNSCSEGTKQEGRYCIPSAPGKYYNNGQEMPCPKGTYKTLFQNVCIPCPGATTTQTTGATSINDCVVHCDNFVGLTGECADSCQNGEAIISGHCIACGNDFVSSDGTSCINMCAAGEEPNENRKCQSCSPGHVNAEPSAQKCTACTPGSISKGGISCQPCASGQAVISNACTSCQNNEVVSENYENCITQCPEGLGAINRHCQQCPAGQFAKNGQCQQCKSNQIAPAGSQSCTNCTGATVPSENKDQCVTCTGATPYVSVDRTTCVSTCQQGEMPGNDDICKKCEVGTASSDGLTCNACTGNQYQDLPGQEQCETCPNGVQGTSSSNNGKNDKCGADCQPGQFKNEQNQCQNCSAGSYSQNGIRCRPCTNLSYSQEGSQSCSQCPDNQIPNEHHSGCVPCDKFIQQLENQTYACQASCSEGYGTTAGSKICTNCPPGHQIIDSVCTPCPAMMFYNSTARKCQTCPENGFSIASSSECTLCTGSTPYVNQYNTGCVEACGASLHLVKGHCVPCAAGKISNQQHNLMCETCPAMSYANKDGTKCEKCPLGAWSVPSQTHCTQCDTGYVSADLDQCVSDCPAGQIRNDTSRSCERCPIGHYVKDQKCYKCGENYQVSLDGTTCQKCPFQTISNKKTGFKCSLCESGLILSVDGLTCQKSCGRNEQPKTIKVELENDSGVYLEGKQCERCPIGYQSIGGQECVFVEATYQQALDDAKRQQSKKIVSIVVPIIVVLIIVGILLTVIFVKKLKKKNSLKTAKFAYGKQKTVATSLLQTRRQVSSIV